MSRSPDADEVIPVYFDSALIAKFYVNEPGRDVVRRLARSKGSVVTSGIAVAEVSAAFHRKFREGSVKRDVFEALDGQFSFDLEQGLWRLVWPTEDLLLAVQALFRKLDKKFFLRSLDALHLVTASAEEFQEIYSNDRRLIDASAAAGLRGINPLADEPPWKIPQA